MMFVAPQLKLLGQLLTPSWLSGLVSIVTGLAVVIAAAAALHYNGSNIQLLRQTESYNQSSISQNSGSVGDSLDDNRFISDLPLFILWGGVGLLAYSLTMQIIRAFTRVVDLEHSLSYVHTDWQRIIREVSQRTAVRAVILLVWLLYIRFTIHILVPYVVALAYAGSGGLGWLSDTEYLLTGACLLAIAIHLHTVMLRLILLRPRVFGQPA